ncbi:MAG: hypothetical protein QOK47_481, partial [Actinomycetota bacterium]|nr:hypothetical protein [Actinomycetota bacterium]
MSALASRSFRELLGRIDARFQSEANDFGIRHPRLATVWRWLVRHRILTLCSLALLHGLYDGFQYMAFDARLFAAAGDRLFTSHAFDVFSDPIVQVGPVLLLFSGIAMRLSVLLGVAMKMVLSPMVQVALALGVVATTRALLADSGRKAPGLEFFAGLVTILGGLAWTASASGHPAEGFIPLLWIWSARFARKQRPIAAGVVLGLSTAMKLWGGLGLPLLLLVPRRRDLATATIAFTTVVVGAFAPFILFGEFTSFDYVWVVKPHSPLAFFIEPLTAVGWPARVIQGAAAVGVGSML